MFENFPLFPVQASTVAERVDALYFFLIAISIFFGTLIAAALVYFAIRYHRRSEDEQVEQIHGSLALEIACSVIPYMICCVVFVWSADVFFSLHRVPVDAMEINVVGKRWMWKLQHMTGQREINTLHIPTGVPVKVTLTSEDGTVLEINAGDAVIIPKEWQGVWDTDGYTKIYVIYSPDEPIE